MYAYQLAKAARTSAFAERPFCAVVGDRTSCFFYTNAGGMVPEGAGPSLTECMRGGDGSADGGGGFLMRLVPGEYCVTQAGTLNPIWWKAERLRRGLPAAAAAAAELVPEAWPEPLFELLADTAPCDDPSQLYVSPGLEPGDEQRVSACFVATLPHYGTRTSSVAVYRQTGDTGAVRLHFFHRDFTPSERGGVAPGPPPYADPLLAARSVCIACDPALHAEPAVPVARNAPRHHRGARREPTGAAGAAARRAPARAARQPSARQRGSLGVLSDVVSVASSSGALGPSLRSRQPPRRAAGERLLG